jgi:acyl-CoA synthetase (AMP-forming)/AMP-acid ligase II
MDPSAIALLLFTSGTTAEPKAAVLRHEHLCSYVLGSVEFASAAEAAAALVSVPPYHIAGALDRRRRGAQPGVSSCQPAGTRR